MELIVVIVVVVVGIVAVVVVIAVVIVVITVVIVVVVVCSPLSAFYFGCILFFCKLVWYFSQHVSIALLRP